MAVTDFSSDGGHSVVTMTDLVEGLSALGLKRGDKLLVHSSLSAFGNVDGGEHTVIDALLRSVGNEGLVAVPTHTWGTVGGRQPVFHVDLSPSIVGRITETFRRRPGAVRSLHPTHSVAVMGDGAEAFVEGHERWSTPCAIESPYGRLVQQHGYVLMLGVTLESCTLIHGFEEWACVPWLFDRTERLYTVTEDGRVLTVMSRRHTSDPNCDRDFEALEPLLQSRGIMRVGRIGNATIRLLDAHKMADLLVGLLRDRPDLVLAQRSEPVPQE